MTIKDPSKSIVTLLGTAMQTLKTHPVIFLPFCFLGFFQLLTLEILYFIPRPPLVSVLGPVVRRLWADAFLHYPLNLILLPKLQYYAQLFIYIIIGAFFAGVAVKLIAVINNEREIRFRDAVRETLAAYVHIFINTFVSFLLFFGMSAVYQLLVKRALLIRSETGILF